MPRRVFHPIDMPVFARLTDTPGSDAAGTQWPA